MTTDVILSMIRPLRLIFWGGLVWLLDFRLQHQFNGWGIRFDILNDAIGTGMIAVGVFRLAKMWDDRRYARAMRIVQIIAVLSVAKAVLENFVVPIPMFVGALLTLFTVCQFMAMVVFCMAMRWFCQGAWLDSAARSWLITAGLFLGIYVLLLGLLYLYSFVAAWRGSPLILTLPASSHWPRVQLLVVMNGVFLVPIIHLFVSTSAMVRAAYANQVRGFPVGEGNVGMTKSEGRRTQG
ncbi:MAG: hypothetical protein ACM359_23685 [Bacillota bacterium]